MEYRNDYRVSEALAVKYFNFNTRLIKTECVSKYKNIPISEIENFYKIVDGSQRFYVMYRGTRKNTKSNATPKADAHSFDVYIRSDREVAELRHERIKYLESLLRI
jgi:hypothetical protein